MGSVLGRWRDMGKGTVVVLLGICAYTYLHNPDFATQAGEVNLEISHIPDTQVQEQMRAPLAVAHFLPVGVRGLLCAALLMGIFGGDATHLHSWGGIFIQDVLVPLREKPYTPEEHIRALRYSILFVAVFAFFFGITFRQTQYISMWWSVTTAVFVAGAGSAIIGGLYWKKGTTTGAWAAVISGSVLSLLGIAAEEIYPDFILNGVEVAFLSNVIAILIYIFVSLLTCQEDFNLEKMLHRGGFASLSEESESDSPKAKWWERVIGIDQHFTFMDKLIAGGLMGWSLLWVIVFIIGSIWNVVQPWSVNVWAEFWDVVGIHVPIFITTVVGLWFTWGGIKDIRDIFRRLAREKINHLDDGTVVNHQNLSEAVPSKSSPLHH
jgi:SSS family solute:Na+ symporter